MISLGIENFGPVKLNQKMVDYRNYILILINMLMMFLLNYYCTLGQSFRNKVNSVDWNKRSTCLSNYTDILFPETCENTYSNFWILSVCKQCENKSDNDLVNGKHSEKFENEPLLFNKSVDGEIATAAEHESSKKIKNTGNISEEIVAERISASNNDKFNFTLVSALFDLHREKWPKFKRKYDQYLNYSIQLLQMNVPLVAFVDATAEAFVWKYRQDKKNVTKIIVTSLNKLEYYEDYDTIKNIMNSEHFKTNHTFLHHPEGFSPDYNILMNSKFSMMYQAAKENHFSSSHVYWIDMGYGHGSDVFPKYKNWAPRNLMYNQSISDKITYIQINDMKLLYSIHQIYKRNVPPFLSGGFFGGSKAAVEHYYFIHRDMFKLFLRHKMIDDDQTLAILCYFKEQALFNFVDGWWYDAFKLFN